jgi:hypothetical protein
MPFSSNPPGASRARSLPAWSGACCCWCWRRMPGCWAGLPLGVGDGPGSPAARSRSTRGASCCRRRRRPSHRPWRLRREPLPRHERCPRPCRRPRRRGSSPPNPRPPVPEAKPPVEAAPEPAAIASAPDVTASAVGGPMPLRHPKVKCGHPRRPVARCRSTPPACLRPATLRYDLRRGGHRRRGHSWIGGPAPTGYEMSMRRPGVRHLGALVAQPRRLLTRGHRARALRREPSRARVCAPPTSSARPERSPSAGRGFEYPLVGGAQDRLSWMVQLAAVLGRPRISPHPGAEKVSMFVAGTRGDGETWTLHRDGRGRSLELPGRPGVEALCTCGASRASPYDTHVDIWLDPARHYLPVRLHCA